MRGRGLTAALTGSSNGIIRVRPRQHQEQHAARRPPPRPGPRGSAGMCGRSKRLLSRMDWCHSQSTCMVWDGACMGLCSPTLEESLIRMTRPRGGPARPHVHLTRSALARLLGLKVAEGDAPAALGSRLQSTPSPPPSCAIGRAPTSPWVRTRGPSSPQRPSAPRSRASSSFFLSCLRPQNSAPPRFTCVIARSSPRPSGVEEVRRAERSTRFALSEETCDAG